MAEGESWVVGRAGMQYRDLIPGRLGGAVIASHIRIPRGGPVPDMVHFHTITFQLIYCYRGWFNLVYEDQGPPFRLEAGDCVIQPSRIRHRVLESSDNGEVIELGVPAEHLTTIDHELALPTGDPRSAAEFSGQRFCRHRRRDATWAAWRLPGFEARRTGIDDATGGVANVEVARAVQTGPPAPSRATTPTSSSRSSWKEACGFGRRGLEAQDLRAGDAFVVPPRDAHRLRTVLREPGAAGGLAAGPVRDHDARGDCSAMPDGSGSERLRDPKHTIAGHRILKRRSEFRLRFAPLQLCADSAIPLRRRQRADDRFQRIMAPER